MLYIYNKTSEEYSYLIEYKLQIEENSTYQLTIL